MAKRFTDTDKWRDEWYGSLSNDNRIIWQYLLDNCTQAGIFKKDWRLLRFQCNTEITEEEFMTVFGDRVIDRGNFFFIPKFLKFQNKKGLNSNKPAVVSIREELIEHNLIAIVQESLGNDFITIKGIGKGKGEDKGKGKGEGIPEPKLDSRETKLKVFEELFSDELYVEQLAMTHRGKDIKQAFEECYTHHSNTPNPPRELWEWKLKLNTWLSNTKYGTSKKTNGTDAINARRAAFAAKHGTSPGG